MEEGKGPDELHRGAATVSPLPEAKGNVPCPKGHARLAKAAMDAPEDRKESGEVVAVHGADVLFAQHTEKGVFGAIWGVLRWGRRPGAQEREESSFLASTHQHMGRLQKAGAAARSMDQYMHCVWPRG